VLRRFADNFTLMHTMRGSDISRIEGFSDAVFGFALTLLVVSTAMPESFADLRHTLEGFPAFAVTFTVMCWIWYEHYHFFKRFALGDGAHGYFSGRRRERMEAAS
jgi:uncharacterized membrane protein